MANYNLTSQQLKDTYQQLVQVSGSAIVDGTGSLVNSFDYPSNSTYNSFSSSVATTLDSIVAGSGSADWSLITNKPAGLVSGSSQINLSLATGVAANATSASYATTSSLADYATSAGAASTANQAALVNITATSTNANYPVMFVSSNGYQSPRIDTETLGIYYNPSTNRLTTSLMNATTFTGNLTGNVTGNVTGTATSASYASNADTLDGLDSSAYAQLSQNNIFSGAQTFTDIVVYGTASVSYLESVTGSAKIIGDAFIILNNSTPTQPKGGISVVDTGSTATTSSFLWDGVNNDWMYEYHLGGDHEQAVALFASGSSVGSPVYPTSNKLQKGTGTHHLHDSNISDDGSQVSITGPVSASTYYGDGSNLTGISPGLISATGSYAIQSSPSLVAPQTTFVSSSSAIGIGAVRVTGEESIGIGYIITSSAANSFALGNRVTSVSSGVVIGYNLRHDGGVMNIGNANSSSGAEAMVIGSSARATGTNTTAIGYQAQAITTNATAIGYSSYANGVNSTAIGNSSAGGVNAVSVGEGANASNTNTTAIGVSANAGGDEAVAIGTAFGVNGSNALGIGRRGTSSGDSSIAIGSLTEATANYAIAIGASVTATSSNAINIGGIFQYNGVSSINLVGSVTSSIGFNGDGSGLTNLNVVSSSYAVSSSFSSTALTASSAENFEVRGQLYSPTFAGSIASSTSSIDFDNGNFATLNCASATFLANPSNLKSGTTYTIIATSGSNISGYGSAFKFAGGTAPTFSSGTDVLTMVSDGTNLYATGLADFQ